MNIRFTFAIIAAFVILAAGCGGSGGGTNLHVTGFIQGLAAVQEESTTQFSVEVSGDTGITYQWIVEPGSAGMFSNPNGEITNFTAAFTDSPLKVIIQVIINSDNSIPIIASHEITIEPYPTGSFLQTGDIDGLTDMDPGDVTLFSIAASGDEDITFKWSCDPPTAGSFTPVDESNTIFMAASEINEWVTIRVEINSLRDGPIMVEHVIAVGDPSGSPPGQDPDPDPDPDPDDPPTIGVITGPLYVNENDTETYELGVEGGTNVTYLWSTYDPEGFGSFNPDDEPVTEWTAPAVDEYTQVWLRCTVSADGIDPVVITHMTVVKDVADVYSLDVSEISGPDTLNETSAGEYSVTADGDTGITYEWTCDPSNAGEFSAPTLAATDFTPVQVTTATDVTLRVEVNSDHVGPIVKLLEITVLDYLMPPVASANADPVPAMLCEDVLFTDNGSVDPDGGDIVKYEWDWDNDGIYDETGPSVYHSWDTPGIYNVGFRVTDNEGAKTALSTPLVVAIENALPTAVAEYEIIPLVVDDPVYFYGGLSTDNDCEGFEIVTWEWDLNGDGTWDKTGPSVSNIYTMAGTYYVQLKVTDDEGAFDLLDVPLEVLIQ